MVTIDPVTDEETVYRIIADHLGSIRLVIEAETGTIAQRIDYGPNPGHSQFGDRKIGAADAFPELEAGGSPLILHLNLVFGGSCSSTWIEMPGPVSFGHTKARSVPVC